MSSVFLNDGDIVITAAEAMACAPEVAALRVALAANAKSVADRARRAAKVRENVRLAAMRAATQAAQPVYPSADHRAAGMRVTGATPAAVPGRAVGPLPTTAVVDGPLAPPATPPRPTAHTRPITPKPAPPAK